MMNAIFSPPGDFDDGTRVPRTKGIGNCEYDLLGITPREFPRIPRRMLRFVQFRYSCLEGFGPLSEEVARTTWVSVRHRGLFR